MKAGIISISICILSLQTIAQSKSAFPYKGGEHELIKQITTYLWAKAADSGRIFFVEIYYDKRDRQIKNLVHGIKGEDLETFWLINSFFQERRQNWYRRRIKKTRVVIPLFLFSSSPEDGSKTTTADIEKICQRLTTSFISGKYYLIKPVVVKNEEFQLEVEPPVN